MSENQSQKMGGLLWALITVIGAIVLIGGLYWVTTQRGAIDEPPVDQPDTPLEQSIPETEDEIEAVVEEAEDVFNRRTLSLEGVERGMSSANFENLLEEHFDTGEGDQTFTMRLTPQTPNGYSLIAIVENMNDPDIAAQEITAQFSPGDGPAFILSDYTIRVKCSGAGFADWSTEACQ